MTSNGETQYTARVTEPIVNTEKLATRDKYAAFLDGNNGYSVIEGDGEDSILVVKDSYANCFVPFLTANYAKIGVVDLRNFSYGLDTTIESEGYDDGAGPVQLPDLHLGQAGRLSGPSHPP